LLGVLRADLRGVRSFPSRRSSDLFLSRGSGVITMAMIGKIRRMHFRQGKSVREIVRLTSLSRNTVRKWLKTPLEGEPRYRRSVRSEEHTSELQSRENLVCRLLLEK